MSKTLHYCFTKLKRPSTIQSSPTPLLEKDLNRSSTTTSSSSSTTTTTSTVLIKNYNSPYDLTPDSTSKSLSLTSNEDLSSSDSDYETTTPDFATIFASQRFFFSSPGRSNSIIDPLEFPPESDTLVDECIPIHTYSPDPYMDFRRSMQEMVEARKLSDVRADWDYLHELLLCYLTLNPKHAHKFIIGAFADLLVSLMTSKSDADCRKSE